MVEGARSDIRAPDGTRLAVYEWGDPAGPEVVLVHGFAQSHLCFEPQIRSDLVRHCRVVAFDMRGHGASAQPDDPSAYQGSRVWADDTFEDPNLPDEMQTTITLKKVSVGTEINIVQEGIPAVIPPEACYLGWQESLAMLAQLVTPEIPG